MEKNASTSKMSPLPLPPPLPRVPPNVVPRRESTSTITCDRMTRPGFASRGQRIPLLTNHFKVTVSKIDGHFYHYSVSIKHEDDSPVNAKDNGRSILKALQETYANELGGKRFAYDGENNLFTVGSLPQKKLEFTVILTDISSSYRSLGVRSSGVDDSQDESARKRSRRQPHSKTYKVAIKYVARIPIQAITDAVRGQDSEQFQEAVRVLDIILRQHAAEKGCLLVRQSFFYNEPRNFVDLGGGVLGCRGFHSGFRATQGGLSLNMDVLTTMIVKPGPVLNFLVENQNVNHPSRIDWTKAKRMLKNLRIKTTHTNIEYKISGLSDRKCNEQMFMLRERREGVSEAREVEISVYHYFVKKHQSSLRDLRDSKHLPCINVGKPRRPVYLPIELCHLVSLQRYTKSLSNLQRASLVEKSRQQPREKMQVLQRALTESKYSDDPLLRASGISISSGFTQIEGRILAPPRLAIGGGEEFIPRNGRWNFNDKRLYEQIKLESWVIVNFSARCDMKELYAKLRRCGERKGMSIHEPWEMVEEESESRRKPTPIRVEKMIEVVRSRLGNQSRRKPCFILCILPERKNCDIYGPWKRENLSKHGIVTQCIAAPTRISDQYLTNLLLKINAKLGGINSMLTIELPNPRPIHLVARAPTLIVGIDVSHGSPGRDIPSIAAVVSSRKWPSISRYRASVRSQSPKLEMVDSLFKKASDSKDEGIFGGLLNDFYDTSKGRKPQQIIIFRDGVSESQFNQVLNVELEQIMEACKFKDESWSPKFMVVVAQKRHHTKFFSADSSNVPAGTVIDRGICHPKINDFYMCAHAGMIGTTRPTHYHVLYDELGCTPDELQELVHSLSYVYQRSTTAISIVAPVRYAHLAAAQMSQFVKLDEGSDMASSSSQADGVSVPRIPELHNNIRDTMFFC